MAKSWSITCPCGALVAEGVAEGLEWEVIHCHACRGCSKPMKIEVNEAEIVVTLLAAYWPKQHYGLIPTIGRCDGD